MLERGLSGRGFEVQTTTDAAEAVALTVQGDFEAVLTDLQLRGGNGLDLCRKLAGDRPDLPVVIVTAFGSLDAAVGAIRAGAYDFITKPVELDALEIALRRAVDRRRLEHEVRRLRRIVADAGRFHEMLGQSPPMQELFHLVGRVAGSDASILVSGESGTGKERVARSLHQASRRAEGPFVAVNCAAIPESLLESELFGHVRGAFTDARQDRPGLFQQANGGTLFLDEIGELPLSIQPKLLRALQERRVRPLGGSEESPFDARLIAATNRDLEDDVRHGRFREDLFFRVHVVHVEVPPLRMRGNDILLLAQHFLESFAAAADKEVRGLGPSAAARLRDYPWPGNVRELQNCMERAVALAEGPEIDAADLPARVRAYQAPISAIAAASGIPLRPLSQVEQDHILHVLEATGGNKAQAARILGLDRKTLYRKLESYGLSPDE